MPKLPVVSGREVVAALERLGFKAARQRGSHVVLRRGIYGTVVPVHREVRVGTPATIIRQAGLTTEQFIDALKQ